MLELKAPKTEQQSSNKTYEDGLREAWEFARFLDATYRHGFFNYDNVGEAMSNCDIYAASK